MIKYWDIIKIDSKKYKSFIVNGFDYETPFNFTSENIGNSSISPGFWNRKDIENILKNNLEYEIKGNMIKILKENKQYETFLKTIGMINYNEWFFMKIPPQPNQIILNFSFEDESVTERKWNYPIIFNKEIRLEEDCILWVSGMINDVKINHPLQRFNVQLKLNERL